MSSYHDLGLKPLTKLSYYSSPGGGNPYGGLSPKPSLGGAEVWQSAPGYQAPAAPTLGDKIWNNKGRIAGSIGGGLAGGAAAGALIGSVVPVAGTAAGAVIGGAASLLGSIGGSMLGEWAGGKADDQINDAAAAGQPYRPPVTGLSSYGHNMLAQSIDQQRANQPQ